MRKDEQLKEKRDREEERRRRRVEADVASERHASNKLFGGIRKLGGPRGAQTIDSGPSTGISNHVEQTATPVAPTGSSTVHGLVQSALAEETAASPEAQKAAEEPVNNQGKKKRNKNRRNKPKSDRATHAEAQTMPMPTLDAPSASRGPPAPLPKWISSTAGVASTVPKSSWGDAPPPLRRQEDIKEDAAGDHNAERYGQEAAVDEVANFDAEASATGQRNEAAEGTSPFQQSLDEDLTAEERQIREALATKRQEDKIQSDRDDFVARRARQERSHPGTWRPDISQSKTSPPLNPNPQQESPAAQAPFRKPEASQSDFNALLDQALGVQPVPELRTVTQTSAPQEGQTARSPAQSTPLASPAATSASVQSSDADSLTEDEERLFQALLAKRKARADADSASAAVAAQSQPESILKASTPNSDSGLSAEEQRERDVLAGRSGEQPKKASEPEPEAHNPEKASEPEPEAYNPEVTAHWSILKRGTDTQVHPLPSASSSEFSVRSAEDIDARFQEHRRQRATFQPYNIPSLDNTKFETAFQRKDDAPERRKCARCGEIGHIARNCPNFKCHKCGGIGHFARDCPQKMNENLAAPQRRGGNDTSHQFSVRKMFAYPTDAVEKSDQNLSFKTWTPHDHTDDARRYFDTREQTAGKSAQATKEGRNASVEETEEYEGNNLSKSGARSQRFAARFGEEEEEGEEAYAVTRERSRKARRNRSEEDEEEDERPRRGRRGRFEEKEGFGEDAYESLRESREDRKKVRKDRKEKAAKEAEKKAAKAARKADALTPIRLPEYISVSQLAQTLGVRYEDFAEKMEELGFTATNHDHVLTSENASLIAMEYNFDPTFGSEANAEDEDLRPRPAVEDKEFLPARPPVVAIMGHVDHGKTTILDYLRKSSVAASEHGGITQHIGAFSVALSSGKTITFLDTPGHAAFLAMRQRGATVTDIVVLVVAADDSVKPQTIEAIKHAKAANVPIIVAINKIDKEEANVERVKQDLARHGVEIEDFGGDTQVVCVSGKTGEGMDELEEAAVTLGEILDHRAETDGMVEGWVLEATTKRAGRVATVLVRRGTLRAGNVVVAGKTWARVRTLKNEAGQLVREAGPGTPVEVDGWKDQPAAGDEVLQAPNEAKATDVVAYRAEREERIKMAEDMEAINEVRRLEQEKRSAAQSAEGQATEGAAARAEGRDSETLSHQTVPFIVKADVSGSVEAVTAYMLQMSNPLCSPTLLRSGVGPVSEFDIEHAAVANGHIIAFNLPKDEQSAALAEKKGVKVLEQNVIYRIVDQVKAVLEEKLPPVRTQRVTGEAEVAMGFEIGVGNRKKIKIAGVKVRNGVVSKNSRVRVMRGGDTVYTGKFDVAWVAEREQDADAVNRHRKFAQKRQEGR